MAPKKPRAPKGLGSILTRNKSKSQSSTTKRAKIISEEERIAGLAQISSRLEAFCKERHTSPNPLPILGGRDSGQGSVKCGDTTLDRYRSVWKGMLDFCILIGDYTSGIILHQSHCPAKPPPVSLKTCILYMRYRVLPPGTSVINPDSTTPFVYGPNKTELKAVGTWTAESTVGNLNSALWTLHRCYETTCDKYQEQCKQCHEIDAEDSKKGHGCSDHGGNPHYWRRGNPSESVLFKNALNVLREYCENNYKHRQTVAFLPFQLRNIRTSLLSSGSLEQLMLWSAMILASKLFLRIDEMLSLHVDSFVVKHFLIKKKKVVALMLKIKGKTDPRCNHFLLWDDDEYPELSPVQPLLLYLAISGRKSGYLFPKLEQINWEDATESYSYYHFLSNMEILFTDVLQLDLLQEDGTEMCAGTHALRKTAYLLAWWAIHTHPTSFQSHFEAADILPVEQLASLSNDARHKSSQSSSTYLQDSPALFHVNERMYNCPTNKVGTYLPSRINFPDSVRAAADPSGTSRGHKQWRRTTLW
ncbi:unnamed protein product [Cylindrotheca closterium]|uniref:Uncharacterized protein n=1 Tax=Cylindrotheca closterium TaxID=2856 RepID=A0AAD2CJ90_9STRA|nr:unnamed protein product [Cylindrotheca closterium]